MAYNKPLPKPNKRTKKFWEGTKRHILLIQKCSKCDKYVFYPKTYCPYCFSDELDWVKASGRGKIYSYTIMMNNPVSSFVDDLPFVIAIIELEEEVRLLSHVVNCDLEKIVCEMEVEVVFEDINEEFTLPKFQPLIVEG